MNILFMNNFKKVTEKEFNKFIDLYPNELTSDIKKFYEPPLGTYQDFTKGEKYTDNIIAYVILYGGLEFYHYKQSEYYIKENI